MTTAPIFLGITLPQGAEHLAETLELAFIESVSLAVVEALPEEKLPAFEEVLLRADEREIGAFLEENVPSAKDAIGGIMQRMQEDLRAFVPA